MQHADTIGAKLALTQTLGLGQRRRRRDRLGLVDRRTDDVHLPTLGELFAHEFVPQRALLFIDQPRHHWLAPRWGPGDRRHIEVGIPCERQRAWDRRRGHVEHVRRATARGCAPRQLVALRDAEAMLLVDDDHGEVAKAHVLLNQRVRADRDLSFTGSEARKRLAPLRGRVAGRQQRDRREIADQRLRRRRVLLGQRLRRRHQCSLVTGLDRAQQRVESDDGLAGAHVTLEEPAHRRRPREIAVDLVDRRSLVLGQQKRQRSDETLSRLSRWSKRRRLGTATLLRLVHQQAHLHAEEFLEYETGTGATSVIERARCMRSDDRVGAPRQPGLDPEADRQRVENAARDRQQAVHDRTQQTRRNGLARRVDGHHTLGMHDLGLFGEDLVALDQEGRPSLARLECPSQAERHAFGEQFEEICLVEPDRFDRAASSRTSALTTWTRRRAVRSRTTRSRRPRTVASSPTRRSATRLRSR